MQLISWLKRSIKVFVPERCLRAYRRRRNRRQSNAERFGEIYRRRLWGGDQSADFFSGAGSTPEVVGPYIASVRGVLAGRPRSVVVEIGCGDFGVGSQLTDLAGLYTACDVVPELIDRNQRLFVRDNLKFVTIDAVTDPLPPGDLVIVRQVFQHLRNDQIQRIVKKLAQYQTWIISEHIPSAKEFVPNVDILSGADNRLAVQSGVVLTERPFSIRPRSAKVLNEAKADTGIIQAIVYTF